MAAREVFLIEASAAARILLPGPLREWRESLESGLVGMCAPTELEMLRSAASVQDHELLRQQQAEVYTRWPVPDAAWTHVHELQRDLARTGAHRPVGPVQLLVAVTALHHGLTVLHYDPCFEAVARATGQAARWLAEPGSLG
ncbi:PIN domain nuclease [Streptacidiphilus sp. PB12-B1b]|uniref:PIN domain-containing protein n=1 Tax=Streptacidiphilus sp. PB12-B1b TaxID=2705012 RepID=UPI0015FE15D4|nr:PIN domain-containing protein [Streptacidiphilus sp. PB12-B1b]QMU75542.1 PIN domain nuclease [Streptacidiphilus sp. PB12-B1b]